jgi:hypothetical protein
MRINRSAGDGVSAPPGQVIRLQSPAPEWEDIAMPKTRFAVAVLLGCTATSALAQDGKEPNAPLRYSFNRVDDGFLRLDNSSGQIAFCSPHSVGWACQAVPEDRAALEKEIARLQDEVASLKTEVAALRAPPPPPPPPRPPADLTPAPKSDDAQQLREDLHRARAAIENAWRRLVDMIVNFQKDMRHKG